MSSKEGQSQGRGEGARWGAFLGAQAEGQMESARAGCLGGPKSRGVPTLRKDNTYSIGLATEVDWKSSNNC